MKKLLITLVAAMALIGAVVGAAASLTVTGVDRLGSESVVVTSPSDYTIEVTRVKFVLDAGDASLVASVDVTLEDIYGDEETTCTLGVNVTGSAGVLGTGTSTVVFTWDGGGDDIQTINVGVGGAPAGDVTGVDITLACEEYLIY